MTYYVLQSFHTTKMTFSLTQGHRQSFHLIVHIWFAICLPF